MADRYRQVVHAESGQIILQKARWCDSFGGKLRGLTFRRQPPGPQADCDGIVLVEKGESRLNTAIHMLFVFFDLGVLWVNDKGRVVDKKVARAWRPVYAPRAPARYVIEADPAIIERVELGDPLRFEEVV